MMQKKKAFVLYLTRLLHLTSDTESGHLWKECQEQQQQSHVIDLDWGCLIWWWKSYWYWTVMLPASLNSRYICWITCHVTPLPPTSPQCWFTYCHLHISAILHLSIGAKNYTGKSFKKFSKYCSSPFRLSAKRVARARARELLLSRVARNIPQKESFSRRLTVMTTIVIVGGGVSD